VRLSLVSARFVRAIIPWHIERRRRRPAHRLRSAERAELEIKLDQMARRSNLAPLGCAWLTEYVKFLRSRYIQFDTGDRSLLAACLALVGAA
jgi:hypothetical protein